mgnify:CR=1 FL=1
MKKKIQKYKNEKKCKLKGKGMNGQKLMFFIFSLFYLF